MKRLLIGLFLMVVGAATVHSAADKDPKPGKNPKPDKPAKAAAPRSPVSVSTWP